MSYTTATVNSVGERVLLEATDLDDRTDDLLTAEKNVIKREKAVEERENAGGKLEGAAMGREVLLGERDAMKMTKRDYHKSANDSHVLPHMLHPETKTDFNERKQDPHQDAGPCKRCQQVYQTHVPQWILEEVLHHFATVEGEKASRKQCKIVGKQNKEHQIRHFARACRICIFTSAGLESSINYCKRSIILKLRTDAVDQVGCDVEVAVDCKNLQKGTWRLATDHAAVEQLLGKVCSYDGPFMEELVDDLLAVTQPTVKMALVADK
ncbi:hypothetical protein B0A55_02959 [Friedmanniomyces simplex]|uniref:Uncharacterized protein n=1 Tax=Friedmanniomyces simplex TaxID=329884 RepID=A0A4U0Y4T3_9PEZI|nr:hypothetical protein B0A55_02959 [Friedmanniomyces simplex]